MVTQPKSNRSCHDQQANSTERLLLCEITFASVGCSSNAFTQCSTCRAHCPMCSSLRNVAPNSALQHGWSLLGLVMDLGCLQRIAAIHMQANHTNEQRELMRHATQFTTTKMVTSLYSAWPVGVLPFSMQKPWMPSCCLAWATLWCHCANLALAASLAFFETVLLWCFDLINCAFLRRPPVDFSRSLATRHFARLYALLQRVLCRAVSTTEQPGPSHEAGWSLTSVFTAMLNHKLQNPLVVCYCWNHTQCVQITMRM